MMSDHIAKVIASVESGEKDQLTPLEQAYFDLLNGLMAAINNTQIEGFLDIDELVEVLLSNSVPKPEAPACDCGHEGLELMFHFDCSWKRWKLMP